jgi:hypothetical protein
LSTNTTYYWAVDEVNGASVISGDIWSFTTETYQQYRVTQLTFTTDQNYSNPVNDVNLICTFNGPNNTDYNIPGFWDGENNWKVRFMPTLAGNWSYVTSCIPNDPCLNNQTGSFNAVAASGDNPLYAHGGLLDIGDTNHHLTYT